MKLAYNQGSMNAQSIKHKSSGTLIAVLHSFVVSEQFSALSCNSPEA